MSTPNFVFDTSSRGEAGASAGGDNRRETVDAAGIIEGAGATERTDTTALSYYEGNQLREMGLSLSKGLGELKSEGTLAFVLTLATEVSLHDWNAITTNGPLVGSVITRAIHRKLDPALHPRWRQRGLDEDELRALEDSGFRSHVMRAGDEDAGAATFLRHQMAMAGMTTAAITATGLWPVMKFLVDMMVWERAIHKAVDEAHARINDMEPKASDTPASFAMNIATWALGFPDADDLGFNKFARYVSTVAEVASAPLPSPPSSPRASSATTSRRSPSMSRSACRLS